MEGPAPKRYAAFLLILALATGPRILIAQQDQTIPDSEWEAVLDATPGTSIRVTLDGGAILKCRLVSATHEVVVVESIDAGSTRFETQRGWWQGNRLAFPRAAVKAIAVTSRPSPGPKAESFDAVRFMVGSGEKVTVTSASGDQVTGVITSISPSQISVRAKGMVKEFIDRDVASIRQSRSDSLADGAKWASRSAQRPAFSRAAPATPGPARWPPPYGVASAPVLASASMP